VITESPTQYRPGLHQFNAALDSDIVLLNKKGSADFGGLIGDHEGCLVYYDFDLLRYNGYNLMGELL